MNRRSWLQWTMVLPWLKVTKAKAGALVSGGMPSTNQPELSAYIDTLIPADEHSPAASSIGIDRKLMASVRQSKRKRLLYLQGLKWLQYEAKRLGAKNFSTLKEFQRIQIVQKAEAAKPKSLENTFFAESRDEVMQLYYADPVSWKGMGMDAPPQPIGHMDYRGPHQRG